jgi:hypothetical protein
MNEIHVPSVCWQKSAAQEAHDPPRFPRLHSYDDRMLAAVLMRCVGCGIEYYLTQTHGYRDRCVDCRWKV